MGDAPGRAGGPASLGDAAPSPDPQTWPDGKASQLKAIAAQKAGFFDGASHVGGDGGRFALVAEVGFHGKEIDDALIDPEDERP